MAKTIIDDLKGEMMANLRHWAKCILITCICLLGAISACKAADIWTNLGLGGGSVQVVAVDPSDPDRVFAGIWYGDGLYRSTDGAASWQALAMAERFPGEDTFKDQVLLALSISSVNPSVVWAAHNLWVARSEDGGDTWTHFPNSMTQRDCLNCGGEGDNWRFVYAVASDPNDEDVVYLGTSGAYNNQYPGGAVYKSANAGVSWEKINQGANLDHTVISMAVDPGNPLIVWAATTDFASTGTVYRSTDSGQNWAPIDTQPFASGTLNLVTPHPVNSNEIFVASYGGVARGIFDGASWNFTYPIADCQRAYGLVFAPSNPQILYVGWKGADNIPKVSRSTNGGLSWETYPLDSVLVNEPRTLAVDPTNPDIVYMGDNGSGVFKSNDGGSTWMSVNIGLNGIVVYDVDVDSSDTTHMIAGTSGGVYERVGAAWHRRLNGWAYAVQFVPGSSYVYFAGFSGDLARTDNNGTDWSISTGVATGIIWDIAIDPTDPGTVFIADESHVRRSSDSGATFTPVLEGVNLSGESHYMQTIAIDPADSSHIYAGGGIFTSPKVLGDLWESRDGGDTWQRTGLTDVIVNKVAVDPRDPDILYAGCGFSDNKQTPLFKSTDGGATWHPAVNGLPVEHITLRGVWADSDTNVYAAGGNGEILYYDGHTVNIVLSGGSQLPGAQQYGLFGVDGTHVFTVGAGGAILRMDGGGWSPMQSNTSEVLSGIWGTSPDDLFAVGNNGTILHFNGTAWNTMVSNTSAFLNEVFGTASDNVYAVGEAGTILHYDGNAWSAMASPTTDDLTALWAASADAVFAGGTNGALIHYDGTAWISMNSGTLFEIEGIWGNSASDIYAVADDAGLALHYDGAAWALSTIPDAMLPSSIWGVPGGSVFVVDYQGGVFRYDGTRWEVLRPSGSRFRSVTDLAFNRSNPDILYASTLHAGVFISPNQGGQWLNLGTPTADVHAISSGSLYAATDNGLYQLTGTGVIAGDISAAATGAMVDNALVYNDLGARSISISGTYMMVSAAGICSVTAAANGHQATTEPNVTVFGSDVTWVNIELGSGLLGTSSSPGSSGNSVIDTSSGSSGCFILAAVKTPGEGIDLNTSWSWVTVSTMSAIFMTIMIMGFSQFRMLLVRRPQTVTMAVFCFISFFLLMTPNLEAGTVFQDVGISGSPNPVGSGARAQGMGGAFIGVADDATAASWNPAGLIQLEKPEASIVAGYQRFEEDFTSDVRPEINNSGEVSDTNLNYLSFTFPFHWHRNMVVSLNFQRLYDFQREFSHQLNFTDVGLDLVQDKHFKQNGFLGALGLAGAIEISPRLSLGVTVNLWTDRLFWENGWTENYTERGTGTQGGVPAVIDTVIRDEYSEFTGMNANLGLLYNPVPSFSIGAVIKTPFTASLRHEYRFNQTQAFGPPVDSVTNSSQTIIEDAKLEMPLSYGVGLSWRASDAFTIDADIYRTHWSDYVLEDDQGNRFSPIDGNFESQADVRDTTQIRIGGEYLLILPENGIVIPLRCGVYYDPEPASGDSRDFYGLAIGSGLVWKKIIFDISYNYRWGNDVDAGNLIATTKADVAQHTVLASLIFHFD